MRKFLIIFFVIIFPSIILGNGLTFNQNSIRNCEELNSERDDFGPVFNIFDNKLYFNSERNGRSYFYLADVSDSLIFMNIRKSESPINIDRNNQSYLSFYTSDEAYLSTYRMESGRPVMNIFKTFRKKMEWTSPVPVDSLMRDAFCGHPTVSHNSEIMIFSSNMGYADDGDTDLWMCTRLSNGSWGNLMSIDELNSSGNEITPFLVGNDTIFYATNGYEGKGGYDLFYSVKVNGSWSRPLPLVELNTEFDESDPSIIDGNLMFASNRPGGLGGLDIYTVKIIETDETSDRTVQPDVIIESLVTSLQLKIDFTIEYNIIAPYIDKLIDPDINRNYYAEHLNSTILKSIYTRMFEQPGAVISCGREIYPIIQDYLCGIKGIADHRLILDEQIPRGLIRSNSTKLSAPYEKGIELVSINPPILDIFINTGENTVRGNWKLLLDNKPDKLILKQGNGILPEEISIDIGNFGNYLLSNDEMKLELENDGQLLASTKISIVRNFSRGRAYKTVGNKRYERNIIMLPADYDKEIVLKYFQSNFSGISDGRKMILNYQTADNISKASEILDILKSSSDVSGGLKIGGKIENMPGELIIPNGYIVLELLSEK